MSGDITGLKHIFKGMIIKKKNKQQQNTEETTFNSI